MNCVYICLLFCLCSCLLQTALSYKVISASNGLLRRQYQVISTTSIIKTYFASPVQLQKMLSSSSTALAAGGRPPRERGGPTIVCKTYPCTLASSSYTLSIYPFHLLQVPQRKSRRTMLYLAQVL